VGTPVLANEDVDALRLVGARWAAALGGRRRSAAGLPVDPDLPLSAPSRSSAAAPRTSRFERLAWEGDYRLRSAGELEVGERGERPRSAPGRWLSGLRRGLLGPPLAVTALVDERLSKRLALPVLSSDALSSVAYGTEAMLGVLLVAASSGLRAMLPIGAAIVVLMVLVAASYRQTIRAYPHGGGSYIVASDNLGRVPGLTAAAGLMTDYILTVAVSVAAGVAALISAFPELAGSRVEIGVGLVALILALNLRGLRQAGAVFSVPTYVFVASILILVAVGIVRAAGDGFHAHAPGALEATETLGVLLILRAFASGCSAMTGIEAISDGVPAFRPPEWRNARTTLTVMVSLLVAMFAGITYLTYQRGVVPEPDKTVLSQLADQILGGGVPYGVVQAATVLILVLAANTAFNDFPRLFFFLARDRYAPRLFLRLGDRLAYSNGIMVLGLAAGALIVAFNGNTDDLIHLYAVGVFLSFTLSQTGMVVRWWRRREPGWKHALVLNAAGAAASALVLLIIGITKFTEGAWIVVVLIPLIVLGCMRVRRHYECAARALAIEPLPDEADGAPTVPRLLRPRPAGGIPSEQAESPDQLEHLAVVPIEGLNRASLRALAYAASTGHPTLALHVAPDEVCAKRMRGYWEAWGAHLPLEVVISPHRALVAAIINYLSALHAGAPDLTLTVVVPEVVPARGWQRILHNQAARRLRAALRREPGIVVISVPFHLPPC
jgi:amino acid transporter